jgi:hypothetical protein
MAAQCANGMNQYCLAIAERASHLTWITDQHQQLAGFYDKRSCTRSSAGLPQRQPSCDDLNAPPLRAG